MDDGEIVFVVEVCARAAASSLLASATGDLHYHYLLPSRHPHVIPDPPMRARGGGSA